MKFTIDTDKIAQRLEKLATQAGDKVKAAAKVTGPRASSLADKASAHAGAYAETILNKLDATREYLERKVADRANGVVETTKVERPKQGTKSSKAPNAEAKAKSSTEANSAEPKEVSQKKAPQLAIQFDRMGINREDSLTSHAQTLQVKPETTVTAFFADLMPLFPAQPSTCWLIRARHPQETAFTDVGYILCDASLVRKPVSLLGETTLGQLNVDKVMGIFRPCTTFHMGTDEEREAVEKALS